MSTGLRIQPRSLSKKVSLIIARGQEIVVVVCLGFFLYSFTVNQIAESQMTPSGAKNTHCCSHR